MDKETDISQNGMNASQPTNLPDEFIRNEYLTHDKVRQLQINNYPLHDSQAESRKKKQIVEKYSNGDESNSYFVSEPSLSEDGDTRNITRSHSKQSDGSLGIQSLQPPRHHRTRNVTSRDVRNYHSGSDNDGAFINKNFGSNSNQTGVETFDAGNDNNPQQQNYAFAVNQFDEHAETADSRQQERQRFLNSSSMNTRNVSSRNWESASPTREIHSTIRVMEYAQRRRIRQRSQQSFHSSPLMRTEKGHINGDQAQMRSVESSASQLDQTQLLLPNGTPISEMYGSTRREKRSLSFDTSMSMTISEHETGDIVDYSRYPNGSLYGEEQHSADDEAVSNYFIQGKQHYKLSHSRSHSTSDTIALGRRRTKDGPSVAFSSNELNVKSKKKQCPVHQPLSASRLHKTSSFDSKNGTKSTARKKSSGNLIGETSEKQKDWNSSIMQYSKQSRHNRSSSAQSIDSESEMKSQTRYLHIVKVEDIDNISDDSGSMSDDEDDKGESSFQRRMRISSSTRSPSVKRKGTTNSPFANIGKSSAEKVARSTFLPTSYGSDEKMYSTFICPRCKTRQREFFTVENAAGRLEGPGSYLALYFAVYVICSLFIFGLEEGWKPLDCIYFAVITLTTAGLGDFVPTTWINKIICSIFIYFGVACIGLLLGSYIASMLDHRANIDRKDKQIDACPNCARIKTMKETAIARNKAALDAKVKYLSERGSKKADKLYKLSLSEYNTATPSRDEDNRKSQVDVWDNPYGSGSPAVSNSSSLNSRLLGSPVTRQILGRQKHTRHASIDVSTSKLFSGVLPTTYGTAMVKNFSDEMISHRTSTNLGRHGQVDTTSTPHKLRTIASSENLYDGTSSASDAESTVLSSSTFSSTEAIWDGSKSQLNAAKYVFLTLRLALFNSMIIIAVGCFGFRFIEGFSFVDSWYFTTVLLTTVGYGDIVPVTDAGKLFATIYILVAGTLLLNNMSSISMIPLELRRRRIERAVLTQFGDHLDDAALRELATGPLVQRLRLATNRTDGLDECTREMFSLAMLVRLGKVTEHDIRGTFSCFRHLDVNNEGVLNSKSIIAGMIAKQRQSTACIANFNQPPPPPPPDVINRDKVDQNLESAWIGRQGSLHVKTAEKSYTFHKVNDEDFTTIRIHDETVGLPLNDV